MGPQAPPWWQDPGRFGPRDVFELEWAADPQISPDGRTVVYVRGRMDIMRDRRHGSLWRISADGTGHRPVTDGVHATSSPRWSPDGDRLVYVSQHEGRTQLFMRWMDSGQTAILTQLSEAPGDLAWSPDGEHIAFTMLVPAKAKPLAAMPEPPSGAVWAPRARVVDKVVYRIDGVGYVREGYRQVFVVPAEGGTPRQLTSGAFHHRGPLSWTPDGAHLIVSANRRDDWAYHPLESELHEIAVTQVDHGRPGDADTTTRGAAPIRALTTRKGPDEYPAVSPNGRYIAYLGFDDNQMSYRVDRLYLLDRRTGQTRELMPGLDRSVARPTWGSDSKGLYFTYDDAGSTMLSYVNLDGRRSPLARDVGGLALGRPYGGGSFSVARTGDFVFTETHADHPADLVIGRARSKLRRLVVLNRDLFAHKRLGQIEELWFPSSHDGRRIHGWLLKPPDFDPARRYPLILEIHGGPYANYGNRFSAECQLYAAAGYVVLYINPRGSTSYGEEFANLIHHAYPGHDYDDLMSGVDAALAKGYIDGDHLYVTGGSGGGVLTSWIVGKTNRFRAAVVAKPVINWASFVLTADFSLLFARYWFPGPPWEEPDHYFARSPLSLVGQMQTPTMLLTGEDDLRTPMSESEQLYQALKLRRIDTALVRIPGAAHGIAARPSHLIAKVVHILAWFERYRGRERPSARPSDERQPTERPGTEPSP